MKADIEALVSVLEEAHPLLHDYNPKEAWYKLIEETKQNLNDSLSQFDFYRHVAPLIVNIHEEHTYIAPSQALEKAHQTQKRILPFEIFLIQNRAYIDTAYTKAAFFPRGTELLTINGRRIETILAAIRAKANFATGTETDFAAAILNREFNFAMGYSYFIEDGTQFDSTRFAITYQVPKSQTVLTAQIAGMLNPFPARTFPHWGETTKPFSLRFYPDSIAHLKISGFTSYPSLKISENDLLKFFRESFSAINEKAVRHLVVDLRDNGGGNPRMASELLRYFVPTTFVPIAYSQLETQEITSVSKVRNPKKFRISKSSLKCEEGRLMVRKLGLYKKHVPRKNAFRGKVYFLMNAKCASATTLFLALADQYKLGLFVGENPSGNYEYVCGHQLAQFNLPHADLSVQVPLQKSKINTTDQGRKHGVRPTYYVPNDLEDVLTYQDTQMKFVFDLIGGRKK